LGPQCMFKDEELLPLAQHGKLVLAFLLTLLALLVYLNIRLYQRWLRHRAGEDDNAPNIDWSQNMDELELDFPLPLGATSKDVECRITSTTLCFAFKNCDRPVELEGTLYRNVRPDECNWQLWPISKPTHVKLSLVKAKMGHWKDVLQDHTNKKAE
jgi:hypothetical protein